MFCFVTFGYLKFYCPKSKNIDKRRAEIGLIPIAEHLKNRFDFEWNLEEQIKRSVKFEQEKLNKNK